MQNALAARVFVHFAHPHEQVLRVAQDRFPFVHKAWWHPAGRWHVICHFMGVQFTQVFKQPNATNAMLHYAIVFLIIALLAGVFGFGGIAGTSAWIAQVLFVVFLVLFLVSLLTGRRPSA
jgi:uncharacterized membrane protein YtjA (UPF0391 family)